MVLMATYPLYVLTGLTIWLTHNAFLSWVVHVAMALVGSPLVLGHLYMAVVNPSSRRGLQGMITGFVDRHWAKHHYRRWYTENFEAAATIRTSANGDGSETHARILCSGCGETTQAPWRHLAAMLPGDAPIFCARCGAAFHRFNVLPDPAELEELLAGASQQKDALTLLAGTLVRYEQAPTTHRHPDFLIAVSQTRNDSDLRRALETQPKVETARATG
jgi:hypothetical protein